jgi:hypothetical protein
MTNIELITQALRKINVIAQIATPTAGQASDALAELNRMMSRWEEENIGLQYYTQSTLSDDFPCADYTHQGVIGSLAAALAANYGRALSPEAVKYMEDGMRTILNKIISKQMRPADMSHLPEGSGRLDYRDITTL